MTTTRDIGKMLGNGEKNGIINFGGYADDKERKEKDDSKTRYEIKKENGL